jgi:hypothetical protein
MSQRTGTNQDGREVTGSSGARAARGNWEQGRGGSPHSENQVNRSGDICVFLLFT